MILKIRWMFKIDKTNFSKIFCKKKKKIMILHEINFKTMDIRRLASLIKKDNLISKKKSENNHRLCDFWSCEENQNLIAYNYFKPILE